MSRYTDLITNYHATRPLFFQHVDLSTRPLLDTRTALDHLVTAFDIDNAVGAQLDILGEWIDAAGTLLFPYPAFSSPGILRGWVMTRASGRDHMTRTVGIPRSVTKPTG